MKTKKFKNLSFTLPCTKSIKYHSTLPYFISTHRDGSIKIFSTTNNSIIKSISDSPAPVRALDIHPSLPMFATGSDDTKITVRFFDQPSFTLEGHLDYIRSLAFHPVVPWLLSCSDDHSARIWNWQSRKCIAILNGHTNYVLSGIFHRTELYAITASLDTTICVWNLASLTRHRSESSFQESLFGSVSVPIISTGTGHHMSVNCLAISENGLIASGSDDNEIRLWRMEGQDLSLKETLLGHIGNITCLKFADNKTLFSGGEDSFVYMWDLDRVGKKEKITKVDESKVWALELNSNKTKMVVGHDKGLEILRIKDTKVFYWAVKNTEIVFKAYPDMNLVYDAIDFEKELPMERKIATLDGNDIREIKRGESLFDGEKIHLVLNWFSGLIYFEIMYNFKGSSIGKFKMGGDQYKRNNNNNSNKSNRERKGNSELHIDRVRKVEQSLGSCFVKIGEKLKLFYISKTNSLTKGNGENWIALGKGRRELFLEFLNKSESSLSNSLAHNNLNDNYNKKLEKENKRIKIDSEILRESKEIDIYSLTFYERKFLLFSRTRDNQFKLYLCSFNEELEKMKIESSLKLQINEKLNNCSSENFTFGIKESKQKNVCEKVIKEISISNDGKNLFVVTKFNIIILELMEKDSENNENTEKEIEMKKVSVYKENYSIKSFHMDEEKSVLLFTTKFKMKYILKNGYVGIIQSFGDKPLKIVRKSFPDKFLFISEGNNNETKNKEKEKNISKNLGSILSQKISCDEYYLFDFCLSKQYGKVEELMRNSTKIFGKRVIEFLGKNDCASIALKFVKSEKVKFELLLNLGEFEKAEEIVEKEKNLDMWKVLKEKVKGKGNEKIYENCLLKIGNNKELIYHYVKNKEKNKLVNLYKKLVERDEKMLCLFGLENIGYETLRMAKEVL